MRKILVLFITILFISCSNYGEKLTYSDTDVYYKDGATKQEAEQLGNYLVESGFSSKGKKKSVQLIRDNDSNNLVFRMVVGDGVVDDSSNDFIFKTFATSLSKLYDNQPIDVHLCNNTFETQKIYAFKDIPKSIDANATQILYTNNVSLEEVNKLKDYLIKSDFADTTPKTVEFDKKDGSYLFRMVVKEGFDKKDSNATILKYFGQNISKDAFDGAPLIVHMCNDKLETIRVVE